MKLDDELARAQGGTPWTRGDTFHGNLSPPLWAGDHACRASGDQRRHAVGRRRRVAEFAGKRRSTLHLGRADQIGRLDHSGPGPLQGFAFADHGAGRRCTDDKAAVPLANVGDAGDLLDIDDQARLGPAGAELNQQIENLSRSHSTGMLVIQ